MFIVQVKFISHEKVICTPNIQYCSLGLCYNFALKLHFNINIKITLSNHYSLK